jgi:TolA-binding protein
MDDIEKLEDQILTLEARIEQLEELEKLNSESLTNVLKIFSEHLLMHDKITDAAKNYAELKEKVKIGP